MVIGTVFTGGTAALVSCGKKTITALDNEVSVLQLLTSLGAVETQGRLLNSGQPELGLGSMVTRVGDFKEGDGKFIFISKKEPGESVFTPLEKGIDVIMLSKGSEVNVELVVPQ